MSKKTTQHLSTCSCSRRSFLRGGGVTLAGFGIASLFPTPFIQHAMASGSNNDRRLLFIFLRGGNDGITPSFPTATSSTRRRSVHRSTYRPRSRTT